MYARFGEVKVTPGKMDDFVRTFREDMIPPARRQNGFKGVVVLADPSANRAILISYWATEADMNAAASSPAAVQTQVHKVADLIEGPPAVTHMKVYHQEM